MSKLLEFFGKHKYVVLVLAGGIVLLLLTRPSPSTGQARDAPLLGGYTTSSGYGYTSAGYVTDAQQHQADETRLSEALSQMSGAGNVSVYLSDKGAVVLCAADSPQMRLQIYTAVAAYTGLTSDRIIILKRE